MADQVAGEVPQAEGLPVEHRAEFRVELGDQVALNRLPLPTETVVHGDVDRNAGVLHPAYRAHEPAAEDRPG